MGSITLSNKDFCQIGQLIQETWGIKMPGNKRVMLESRLMKRLRQLNIASFREYRDYLFSPEGEKEELRHLIDAVSTNKTDFFREPKAFNFLTERVLPQIWKRSGLGGGKRCTAWSAGCSTGEEPYTLAMIMNEFFEKNGGNDFNYTILATDISATALEKAKLAVYDLERIEPIPFDWRRRYLLRSKNPKMREFRIVPEIRGRVNFQRLNLMGNFEFREEIDFAFCRNVIIYFEPATQERVLNRLCDFLAPGGYLFMGHSETLNGMNLPLSSVGPMVYKKSGG